MEMYGWDRIESLWNITSQVYSLFQIMNKILLLVYLEDPGHKMQHCGTLLL